MRAILVVLHRYLGLALALFLAFAGLTGSAISFNEEIDAWLNPTLFEAPARGPSLAPGELVAAVERARPEAVVTFVPLDQKPGEAVAVRVEGRAGARLGNDQLFVDPVSGGILGGRKWGECCFSAPRLMPFLYRAHYTLALPGIWGIFLMGGVGILWAIDCLIGFVLTLPRQRPFFPKWAVAWRVKSGASRFRLCFDLHRAGGLWFWAVLLIVATSGVAMNLPEQVFRPVVALFSPLKPSLLAVAGARYRENPPKATLTYDEAIGLAHREAAREGFTIEPRYVLHYPAYTAYGVGFLRTGQSESTGLGSSAFYFDDRNGSLVTRDVPDEGSAGDVYAAAQYVLHTGRIVGLPGRIVVCASGLVVTVLSVTGVLIWLRKRSARRAAQRSTVPPAAIAAAHHPG